ncbi:MAG TPA: hypothetical protein DCM14_00210 [Clostridiales bacterium UBA8153]|nr:hypothetical protein [Clostridiales bacterium UBA8153]
MIPEAMDVKGSRSTSWVVIGLGAAVSAAGLVIPGKLGSGAVGFGAAHMLLGALDMLRPTGRR